MFILRCGPVWLSNDHITVSRGKKLTKVFELGGQTELTQTPPPLQVRYIVLCVAHAKKRAKRIQSPLKGATRPRRIGWHQRQEFFKTRLLCAALSNSGGCTLPACNCLCFVCGWAGTELSANDKFAVLQRVQCIKTDT